ncbi:hypothetical protein DRP53_06405 [candidate division WOR-3 bacterium]|uniref:Glycosyltransferase RgtA/B/C/D-like domain-containing protein n=1 Tax=candidate division WOR-3 bacterium TaxID=2052148 RepID=A0A660SGR7_UNCW3|nr:MAG: hypothetical protein DRP53_06405 [candidate division WOR-3 bacterium]
MKKILIILLIGFGLRIWGISFGLPNIFARPDEARVINVAVRFFTGDMNPHFFFYPTLLMYLLHFIFRIYAIIKPGIISVYNPQFYLIARLVSAIAGTATCYFLYRIGKEYHSEKLGLTAAFILALLYLHVRDSHFGTTDILTTLLIIISFYFMLRITRQPNITSYFLAGLFLGLATSTKYTAFFLVFELILIHILTPHRDSKKLLVSILTAIVGFIATSPYTLIDFHTFKTSTLLEFKHQSLGHMINGFPPIRLEQGWWYHLRFSLWFGMGPTLMIASFLGIGLHFQKSFKTALIFYFPALIFYCIIGRSWVVFVRYAIPLLPFLVLGSGFLISQISEYVKFLRGEVMTFILVIILMIPSIRCIILCNQLLSRKDTRVIAAEWIKRNLPSGLTTTQLGSKWSEVQLRTLQPVPLSSNPELVIVKKSPLRYYDLIPREIEESLQKEYHLIKKIQTATGRGKGRYDEQDAFYLPYIGLEAISRPGPNIEIYLRN